MDYSEMTFERILQRCLERVPSAVDKREGSIIYDALAPAAVELAILYTELSTILDRANIDTATGLDLDNKARERGIFRAAATPAIRKGTFTGSSGAMGIPIGSRFTGGSVNYVVTEKISATASDGKNYKIKYYNLDVVISIGYRVKSIRGVIFRKWANQILREYLLKGYVINENRVVVSNENYIKLSNEVASINNRLINVEDKVFNKEYNLDKIDSTLSLFFTTSKQNESIVHILALFNKVTCLCNLSSSGFSSEYL
mgnify:CR=1 FL=1